MVAEVSKEAALQRGLRIGKQHADELVTLYESHAKSETLRGNDLLLINYAHTIMLCEQNLIGREDTRQILTTIKSIENVGVEKAISIDPHVGDLTTHMEAYIIKATGENVGGRIHTGRSRNDLYATLTKMLIRRAALKIVTALIELENTLLRMASQHLETVLPGYTHNSQHAQPVTLGHFLVGNFDVFLRDITRLENLWPRLNSCPMGGAALAGTGFPLNRARVAELLGFDSVHEHTYDATSSRDFLLEYLSVLSIIASDMGRITQDLLLWNTFEFGMISLADEFTSFSSIMPQKKNPVALESIRSFGVTIAGKFFNAFGMLKDEGWGNSRSVTILDDDSAETGRLLGNMILLLRGILETTEVRKERMYELAKQGFSTATELADTLVREYRLSFRTAHEVVGLVVKQAIESGRNSDEITSSMVEAAMKESLGKTIRIESSFVDQALDPAKNVRIRNLPGGPAPEEVTRMVGQRRLILDEKRDSLSKRQQRIENSYRELRNRVNDILGEEV